MPRPTLSVVVALMLGLVVGAVGEHILSIREHASAWITTKSPPSRFGLKTDIGLSEAAVEADIDMPVPISLTGKVKFLPAPNGSAASVLGYVVRVTVPPLDLKKVPSKYLHSRPGPGTGVTLVPVSQVIYDANVELQLLDRDGFVLKTLQGPTEAVSSGETNVLQNIIPKPIPPDIARRTRAVTLELDLAKCDTCDSQ